MNIIEKINAGDFNKIQSILLKRTTGFLRFLPEAALDNFFGGNLSDAIHYAADHRKWHIVKLLLDFGVDINYKDHSGETLLMKAVGRGTVEHVEFLLKAGAIVNSQRNDGLTALMMALKGFKKEIAFFLVLNGADIEIKDYHGHATLSPYHFSPKHLASTNVEFHNEIVSLIKSMNEQQYLDDAINASPEIQDFHF